jgi:DNA-directed RNA polymerase III subunit RPC7
MFAYLPDFLAWLPRRSSSCNAPVSIMPKSTEPNSIRPQKYTVPFARKLSPAEQTQVDYYRELRETFHEGPFYSVLDASSSNAKKGSAARANFDAFHGMPTYSGRYQKKRRTLPKITGRSYCKLFFTSAGFSMASYD